MEMPMDVLNQRLGQIRDNGDIDFDNTAAALDIDMELQAKFLFFPFAELEAVDIDESRGELHAGSGPEYCTARPDENPDWLYNHAINALALWWKLKNAQERAERQQAEAAKLAARPEPGAYLGTAAGGKGERFTVIVTADRRVLVPANHTYERKLNDHTDLWDEHARHSWQLQRINLTDGTVSA